MADTLSPQQRSALMTRIRGRNTKPEWTVRRLLHGMGYRYHLHSHDLPGKPDLVFRSRQKIIFVHGCFWHWHDDPLCRGGHLPKSRKDFWVPKLTATRKRDIQKQTLLAHLGWDVLVLWECDLRDLAQVSAKLRSFLGDTRHGPSSGQAKGSVRC